MQETNSISKPIVGMNRDYNLSLLKAEQYALAINADTESEIGDGVNITNEPSNYLTLNFPQGYKVIGYKVDLLKTRTYFWLTNPETGKSSIGYISSVQEEGENVDDYNSCGDCNEGYNDLDTPLENITQTPSHQYIELLNDSCHAKEEGLEFDINYPIKFIELKSEKFGTRAYWDDDKNPSRYLDLDALEEARVENKPSYLFIKEVPCGEDEILDCPNIEKLRHFPLHTIMQIEPTAVQTGGNLKLGTYEYWGAYCDLLGNEITNYCEPSNPISIFDENNNLLEQTELDSFTNYSIRLTINHLDTSFPYYKIVCVESTNLSNAQTAHVVGIYPTTDNIVLYTSSSSASNNEYLTVGTGKITRAVDLYTLYNQRPMYEKAVGNMSSGNRLFKWGLTKKTLVNLQPAVNLFGSLLKWQTSVAKEDLYKNPIATSKYKGNPRDEVIPFALRFFNKDGSYSPVYPLIGRPLQGNDNEIVTDKNYQSLSENTPNCTDVVRNKRWQIFNTASENKRVGDTDWNCSYTINVSESTEDIYKSCEIEDVAVIPSGSTTLTENIDNFRDLRYYSNNNPDVDIPEIKPYLENTYPSVHCQPTYKDCKTPVLIDSFNTISEIENESYEYNPKAESDYGRSSAPSFCVSYSTDSQGNKVQDESFKSTFGGCNKTIYKRTALSNEICNSSATVLDNTVSVNQEGTAYYHKYYGSQTRTDLLSTKTAFVSDSDFDLKLHKGALFFKISKNNRKKLIFEIAHTKDCTNSDDITTSTKLRYSFYEKCNSTTALGGEIFNTQNGVLKELDVSSFPNTFYVAIDAPIVYTSIGRICVGPLPSDFIDVYQVRPTCGCFTPFTRSLENESITVSWDSISIKKTEKYKASCSYKTPAVKDCEPTPFAQGEFAFWESTEEYPNNSELYDSSNLKITESDLSLLNEKDKQNFKDFFMDGVIGELVKEATDFRCKKIRHFKMPDNRVAPFMSTTTTKHFADTLIFPLGVTIDNSVVKTLLQVAYNNKLITKKELENVEGFEILRGDISTQKSIIANGLGYDMYKYKRENKLFYYANYPFNDLGQDILHYDDDGSKRFIQHPFLGNENNRFSMISPDLFQKPPTLPTEMVMSGYQTGGSLGRFPEVKNHPKWVILGNGARALATTLAGFEFALETAVKIADFTTQSALGNSWFIGGVGSTGTNATGVISSGIALGVLAGLTVANAPGAVGKYRYQWLKTFRDLGPMYNFASYHVAHGHHNNFIKNSEDVDYIRGLSLRKYMKDGEYKYVDENTGERISVNNRLREASVLLSTGNHTFKYSDSYKTYDNNLLDKNTSSRTISSENNCNRNTEYSRNVGSPYFTLKNYVADQHGKIDSVGWMSTNYRFNLNDESECTTIFGGTSCISRFTWKRKIPIFTATAMGLSDKLAVEYSPYKNIGKPVYYCDYEVDTEQNILFLPAPDIDSNYDFDCTSPTNRMYIRPESKFYLYYYGIADFLVESDINCNFRYGKREPKNQFYPQVGDMEEWTQQVNVPIKEPNTFYYNDVYSFPVSKVPYSFLDRTYNKEEWAKRNSQENGVIYSEMDNSQNDIVDPWLVFKANNWHEFDKKYGKLIQLKDLESFQILGRFENGMNIFNAQDNLADRITPQNKGLGTAGVFAIRPVEFKKADLGYAGTQHSDMVSTPQGHFWMDAKRGRVFMLGSNGSSLEPISESLGGQPSNMKNWFREHAPMKILKQFPDVDVDNKFKGIGYNIWYDDRKSRVFFTKRDYIIKKKDCLKYERAIGFYTDCGEGTITCPEGYTYNTTTQKCEKETQTANLCPTGYTYNSITKTCTLVETSPANCLVTFRTHIGVTPGTTTGIENIINFLTQSPSQLKCLVEQSKWCASSSSNLQTQGLPLQIGQQLYSNNNPYTATGSILVEDINNIQTLEVIGGCGGATLPTTTSVVTVNLGVIQTISLLTSLPNC
jgi:hypothetical protein